MVNGFSSTETPPKRVLIFSNFSGRDVAELLRRIAEGLQEKAIQVEHMISTSYDVRLNGQRESGKKWNKQSPITGTTPITDYRGVRRSKSEQPVRPKPSEGVCSNLENPGFPGNRVGGTDDRGSIEPSKTNRTHQWYSSVGHWQSTFGQWRSSAP